MKASVGQRQDRKYTKDEKGFWVMVEGIGWGTKTTDCKDIQAKLAAAYKPQDIQNFGNILHSFKKEVMAAIKGFVKDDWSQVALGDDGFDDLCNHIVGRGRDEFERVLRSPVLGCSRAKAGYGIPQGYTESFAYCFHPLDPEVLAPAPVVPGIKTFAVPLHYKGLYNFVVKAKSAEDAKEKATAMFRNGDRPVMLGNEFEEPDHFGDVEEVPSSRAPNPS